MIRLYYLTNAILLGLALTNCQIQPPCSTASAFPFSDWMPYLDQPIDQIEESKENAQVQQEMNYTAANLAFAQDAKLYILFHQYLGSLPEQERTAEIQEQREWLRERDAKRNRTRAPYEGGTAASLVGSVAFEEITHVRINEIQKRIAAAKKMND